MSEVASIKHSVLNGASLGPDGGICEAGEGRTAVSACHRETRGADVTELPAGFKIRRVVVRDLPMLKWLHDRCFPICYPDDFYLKLLRPHWLALVATVPRQPDSSDGADTAWTEPSSSLPDDIAPDDDPNDNIIGFISGIGKMQSHSGSSSLLSLPLSLLSYVFSSRHFLSGDDAPAKPGVQHSAGVFSLYFPSPTGYISTFGVHPRYRRLGIGKRLLRVFLSHVDEQVPLQFDDEDSAKINKQSGFFAKLTEYFMLHSPTEAGVMALILLVRLGERLLARFAPASRPAKPRDGSKGAGEKGWSSEESQFGKITAVWLHVLSTNSTAIAFYKRNGFRAVGLLRHFYYFDNKDHDALLMGLNLEDWWHRQTKDYSPNENNHGSAPPGDGSSAIEQRGAPATLSQRIERRLSLAPWPQLEPALLRDGGRAPLRPFLPELLTMDEFAANNLSLWGAIFLLTLVSWMVLLGWLLLYRSSRSCPSASCS